MTSAYTAARVYIHSRDEIESFFDGLSLVPPGVVPVSHWSGEGPVPHGEMPTATFLGGVARKALGKPRPPQAGGLGRGLRFRSG